MGYSREWDSKGYRREMERIRSKGIDRHCHTQQGIDDLSEAVVGDLITTAKRCKASQSIYDANGNEMSATGWRIKKKDISFWLDKLGLSYDYFMRLMSKANLMGYCER